MGLFGNRTFWHINGAEYSKNRLKSEQFQAVLWSCWADSNCRPHPYQRLGSRPKHPFGCFFALLARFQRAAASILNGVSNTKYRVAETFFPLQIILFSAQFLHPAQDALKRHFAFRQFRAERREGVRQILSLGKVQQFAGMPLGLQRLCIAQSIGF